MSWREWIVSDVVVLRQDMTAEGLEAGAIGSLADVSDDDWVSVEFESGSTVRVPRAAVRNVTVPNARIDPLTVVRPDPAAPEWEWRRANAPDFPIKLGDHVLYIGAVTNCLGHCAVALADGRIVWLLHTSEFEAVPDDEV